jgi:hypothetical protein
MVDPIRLTSDALDSAAAQHSENTTRRQTIQDAQPLSTFVSRFDGNRAILSAGGGEIPANQITNGGIRLGSRGVFNEGGRSLNGLQYRQRVIRPELVQRAIANVRYVALIATQYRLLRVTETFRAQLEEQWRWFACDETHSLELHESGFFQAADLSSGSDLPVNVGRQGGARYPTMTIIDSNTFLLQIGGIKYNDGSLSGSRSVTVTTIVVKNWQVHYKHQILMPVNSSGNSEPITYPSELNSYLPWLAPRVFAYRPWFFESSAFLSADSNYEQWLNTVSRPNVDKNFIPSTLRYKLDPSKVTNDFSQGTYLNRDQNATANLIFSQTERGAYLETLLRTKEWTYDTPLQITTRTYGPIQLNGISTPITNKTFLPEDTIYVNDRFQTMQNIINQSITRRDSVDDEDTLKLGTYIVNTLHSQITMSL